MAKRESQGLQIALILVVMTAVLLAVTTILFWNQGTKARAEAGAATARAAEANTNLNQKVNENQTLKELLGYPVDESMDSISQNHATDMQRFAQYAQETQNYRELPKFLDQTIQQQLSKINDYEARVRQLELDNKQLTEERDRLVQVEKEAHDQAGKDLLTTRTDWTSDRDKIAAERDALQAKFKKDVQDLTQQLAEAQKTASDLQGENRSLLNNNENLSRKLSELQDQSFERPDGEITWVSQRGAVAYINLGSADSLQRQTTFSVYDVAATGLVSEAKKGSIEVVRIVADHLAEAKIVEDDVTNPIVTGDIIYSPIWEVGNPVRFALTGFMDIDGDGISDRDLIKRLIAVNGGVVDAEVDDQGVRTGEISIQTRYLVVGDSVGEQTQSRALLDADQALKKQATALGVTVISVDRLLSELGHRQVSKAIALGEVDAAP